MNKLPKNLLIGIARFFWHHIPMTKYLLLILCLTSVGFAQSNTSVRRFPVLVSFNKVWLWVPWFGHTGREPYIDKKGVLRVDTKAICIYFGASCTRNQLGNIHIYGISNVDSVGKRADIFAKDIAVQKDFLGEDSYMVPLKSFAKVFGFSMRWDKRGKRVEVTMERTPFWAPAATFVREDHADDYLGRYHAYLKTDTDFSFHPNFRAQFDVGPAFIDLVVNKDGNIFVDNFKDKFKNKELWKQIWLSEFSQKLWRIRKLGVGAYSPEYFIPQNSRPLTITNPNYIPFDSLNNKSGASCVNFKGSDFACGVPVIPNDTQYNMHVGNSFRLPGTIPYVAGYLYPFFPKSRQKQYYPCAPQKPCIEKTGN